LLIVDGKWSVCNVLKQKKAADKLIKNNLQICGSSPYFLCGLWLLREIFQSVLGYN